MVVSIYTWSTLPILVSLVHLYFFWLYDFPVVHVHSRIKIHQLQSSWYQRPKQKMFSICKILAASWLPTSKSQFWLSFPPLFLFRLLWQIVAFFCLKWNKINWGKISPNKQNGSANEESNKILMPPKPKKYHFA